MGSRRLLSARLIRRLVVRGGRRGHAAGPVLVVAAVVVAVAFSSVAAFAGVLNLVYSSQRGPVIHKLVVDEVFWLPHGYTYDKVHGDARYELLMRRFVSDLGGTPYYNIVTQYPDSTKVAPSNSVKLDDSVVDTTNRYPNDVPLTRKDVSSEVHRMVVKRHWKEDGNHLFIVFTGKGIRVYKGADAYHDAFYDGSTLTYFAAIPIEAPIKGASPNADPQADGEGDALSHEIFEAVTDPAYHFKVAWRDINKQEIGDKCQTNAADPPRNAQGANIYLHGHPYKIGSRWSNDVSGCTPDLCGKSDCGLPLRLTLTAAATTPAGASISYSFNTKNTSDTNASTSTTVTDILPAGLTYKAGSSNSPVTVNGQTLTWSRGTLAVHDTWSVTFQATPNNSLTGTTVKNCAQLTHNDAIGRPVLDLIGASCASTAVQP